MVLAIGIAVVLVLVLRGGSEPSTVSTPPEPDPVAVEATSVYDFGSLEELAAASDLVVRARVVDTARGEMIGADGADPASAGIVVREVTLEVDEVLRTGGPTVAVGTRLAVAEEGWLASGEPLIVDGLGASATGDDGIWFLQRVAGSADGAPGDRFVVVNSQGRYLVDGGRLTGATGDDPLVRSIVSLTPSELTTTLRG